MLIALPLLLAACHRGSEPDDSAAEAPAPGVLRLGPPSPSVGAYGIAAPAGSGKVYVSNLHVPFITIADAETGAWIDSLDLRDGCADLPFFPRLFVYQDVLWITDVDLTRMCRYDLAADTWLPYVTVPGMVEAVTLADDGIWIATQSALTRHDGTAFVESVPVDAWASAIAVEGDDIAIIVLGTVSLLDRAGTVRWSVDLGDDTLQDVALFDGRVFVTQRETGDVIALEDGAEVGRVHTGSDTFAVDHVGDMLYVTNRQGAALPESGAYEGAGGVVTALTRDLDTSWSTTLTKTIHFLAYDGTSLWTANEDALRLSRLDITDGTETVRSEPIGLTLDHVDVVGDDLYFGSHLTDEIWRTDRTGDRTASASVCGWPLVAVPFQDQLAVPCQESGDIWTVDPESMDVTAQEHVADTFFPPCTDGLCTSHDVLIAAAVDGDTLVYTDGYDSSVRFSDGSAPVDLGEFGEQANVQHFDVLPASQLDPAATGVIAFEPRSQSVYRVIDGVVTASVVIEGASAAFPFVPEGDHAWVGAGALDADLTEVARLPDGSIALAADADFLVAQQGYDLVVFAVGTLDEQGRLDIADLRVPPYTELNGDPGPLRYRVVDGELVVANTMRGTVERRALPSLAAVGDDTVRAVGRWAEWDGLR